MYRYFVTLDIVDNTGGMVNPFQEEYEIVSETKEDAIEKAMDKFNSIDANNKDYISITNASAKVFVIKKGMTLLYRHPRAELQGIFIAGENVSDGRANLRYIGAIGDKSSYDLLDCRYVEKKDQYLYQEMVDFRAESLKRF